MHAPRVPQLSDFFFPLNEEYFSFMRSCKTGSIARIEVAHASFIGSYETRSPRNQFITRSLQCLQQKKGLFDEILGLMADVFVSVL